MGFGIFGWKARDSPTEKVIFDLKEVKMRIIPGRESSKGKGAVEGAC